MSSEVKEMNNNRNQQSEKRIKHIWVKEFHRLENLYAKIRKKDYKTKRLQDHKF